MPGNAPGSDRGRMGLMPTSGRLWRAVLRTARTINGNVGRSTSGPRIHRPDHLRTPPRAVADLCEIGDVRHANWLRTSDPAYRAAISDELLKISA